MDSFEEYFKNFSYYFRSHLYSSFDNAIILVMVIVALVAIGYVVLKIWKKIQTRRYYEKIYADICEIHGLSVEEKIKLNYLSYAMKVKHPIFLTIQPKRWQFFLSDPEVLYLYKKLFS